MYIGILYWLFPVACTAQVGVPQALGYLLLIYQALVLLVVGMMATILEQAILPRLKPRTLILNISYLLFQEPYSTVVC